MGVAKKDPSPEGATPLAGPGLPRGSRPGRCDAAPIRGLGRMGSPVRLVTPGLTPPGSMISPPSGALNILVSINRNRMEAMPVQDQLFTTPGRASWRAECHGRLGGASPWAVQSCS